VTPLDPASSPAALRARGRRPPPDRSPPRRPPPRRPRARGRPYLVTEHVRGESLQARLDREGPLPIDDAVGIAAALGHCHAQGLLHRDLKPANVLVYDDGEPRLADFGLTRDLDPFCSQSRLSVRGRFLGTPGYWAPRAGPRRPRGDWARRRRLRARRHPRRAPHRPPPGLRADDPRIPRPPADVKPYRWRYWLRITDPNVETRTKRASEPRA